MFSVDGMQWNIPCDITRTAEIKLSDISGMLLDKSFFADPLGTYMSYDVLLAVPIGWEDTYIALYEKLTDPVDGHSFTFPYNSDTLTITARVDGGIKDAYKRGPGNTVKWVGIQFTVVANAPTKQRTLQESISAGQTPYPDIEEVAVGETYEYTEDGWEQTGLRNVDEEPY